MVTRPTLRKSGIPSLFIHVAYNKKGQLAEAEHTAIRSEGYQEALSSARKDPLFGHFVMHERGRSDGRLGYLEEGKKRIE